MSEERKAELRQAQFIRAYPRRGKAEFTDENDHNPLAFNDCALCQGTGKRCVEQTPGVLDRIECEHCRGLGTTFIVEPYFPEPSEPVDVPPNDYGWLHCPKCGVRFLPTDHHVWTGLRHLPCGQKIRIATG